jgi:hypothetical protein
MLFHIGCDVVPHRVIHVLAAAQPREAGRAGASSRLNAVLDTEAVRREGHVIDDVLLECVEVTVGDINHLGARTPLRGRRMGSALRRSTIPTTD